MGMTGMTMTDDEHAALRVELLLAYHSHFEADTERLHAVEKALRAEMMSAIRKLYRFLYERDIGQDMAYLGTVKKSKGGKNGRGHPGTNQ